MENNLKTTKTRTAVHPQKPDQGKLVTRWATIAVCIAVTILAALFVVQPLSAQSGAGSIEGTVTDLSGSVIAGASVKATNVGTGQVTAMNTSSAGFYSLTPLAPGEYTVEFKAQGFAAGRQEHIKVEPIEVTGLNAILQVGAVTAEVVVTTAPPALDTENGTLDAVLPSEAYSALPVAMNGGPKAPSAFTALLPQTSNQGGFGTWNFDGGVQGTGNTYVNGVQVTDDNLAGNAVFDGAMTTEAVQEFQVITSGVPAQYNGQGIMNLVPKSGTNHIHGDIYENVRNTLFDGTAYSGTTVPIDRQNEYGVSVGGPILRNRLFFFGNYDRYKYTGASTPTPSSLPTTAERAGDFSALPVPIYDPVTTYTNADGTKTRCAFGQTATVAGGYESCSGAPTNIIPSSRISSVSKYFESFLPAPINGNLQNNYIGSAPNGNTRTSYMGKLDYAINSNNHLYALASAGISGQLGYPAIDGVVLPLPYAHTFLSPGSHWVTQLGETWTIKPNLVNTLTLGYDRGIGDREDVSDSANYPTAAGLTGIPPGVAQHNWPQINFGGSRAPTSWGTTNMDDQKTAFDNFILQDNLQWTKGKHSLSMGYIFAYQEYLYSITDNLAFGFGNVETAGYYQPGGTQSGINTATGNSYASYLLGLVDSSSLRDQFVPETDGRTHQWTLFYQDDWKLTPRLTLNLGLRYTAWYPYTDTKNHQSWTSLTMINPLLGIPGAEQFAGDGPDSCHCATLDKIWYGAGFDPRVGFAYSLNPKTVIRGSFTINHFFGSSLGGSNQYQGTNLIGYNANPNFNSPDDGIDPAFNWNNGIPAYSKPPFLSATYGTSFTTLNGINAGNGQYNFTNEPGQAARPPYAENWSLTIERSLTPSLVWNASYSGNESHHIATFGGVGANSGMMYPQYLALGSLLYAQTTDGNWPAELAQAQAKFPQIKVPYSSFYGPLYQMLKPFPQFSWVDDRLAEGSNGVYHSLTTSVTKRMSNGLFLLASYVWSKNIDDGGGTIPWGTIFDDAVHNPYDLRSVRSVSASDQANAIKAAWVYTLPFGRGHAIGGQNELTNAILGGWQVAGDNTYLSGTPIIGITGACNIPGFFPGVSGCYADYATGFTGKARINGHYHGDETQTQWLNPKAFQDAVPYTFGNIPRTVPYKGFRMPWSLNEDADIAKDFQLNERFKLRFQWDAFNLFNRTIFGGMNTNIDQSNFGYLSGQANTQRQMQGEVYLKF